MTDQLSEIGKFLLQLDKLKAVNRRTYINGGERVENSAEHSWHLAIACWAYAQHISDEFDIDKLIKLALVHDIGEIDAGDTFLYGTDRPTAHVKERECVNRIASHPGNPIKNIPELWEEQEAGSSKEAKLLKVIDRILPFLHNITSEGQAWKDNNINAIQVHEMHAFIEEESPENYEWFCKKLDYAIEQGWLNAH